MTSQQQHNFCGKPHAVSLKCTILNMISAVNIYRGVPVTPYSLNRRFCFSVISAYLSYLSYLPLPNWQAYVHTFCGHPGLHEHSADILRFLQCRETIVTIKQQWFHFLLQTARMATDHARVSSLPSAPKKSIGISPFSRRRAGSLLLLRQYRS